ANASWMVPLILGEPFRSGAVAFAILTIECVVSGAAYVLGQHLQAAGAVRAVINRNALSIVPIGLGLYFLSAENVVVVMAILLLASGLVRLVATLLTFRRTHGWVQIMPVPSRNDVALMKASLVKKGK
ncbi:hypothetical protein, partial [Nocardioides massiliensis]|uniref:hypothetical protein n=1 Tax=Nocardioides massiliensis TaxID=1325935 RepID=UPI000B17321C